MQNRRKALTLKYGQGKTSGALLRRALALLALTLVAASLIGCGETDRLRHVAASIEELDSVSLDIPFNWKTEKDDDGMIEITPTKFDGRITLGVHVTPMSEFADDTAVLGYWKSADESIQGDWEKLSDSDEKAPIYEAPVSFTDEGDYKGCVRVIISGQNAMGVRAYAASADWDNAERSIREVLDTFTIEKKSKPGYKSSDFLHYTLDTDYSFQGVTIKGDSKWTVDQPVPHDYYVTFDEPDNSHFSFYSFLDNQASTLDGAWEAIASPAEGARIELTQSWNKDGVVYKSGRYSNVDTCTDHFIVSGNEVKTGKGFLLTCSVNSYNWSNEMTEKLFNAVLETLTYDPSQTTWDSEKNRSSVEADKTDSSADKLTQSTNGSNQQVPSMSQKNALESAKSYIAHSGFSRQSLIDQLKYEGYSTADAAYGADNCGADWFAEAAEKAKSYLKHSSFSHAGLVDQLMYEGFTAEQAEHGVTSAGI